VLGGTEGPIPIKVPTKGGAEARALMGFGPHFAAPRHAEGKGEGEGVVGECTGLSVTLKAP
jgi:hypothetical protein